MEVSILKKSAKVWIALLLVLALLLLVGAFFMIRYIITAADKSGWTTIAGAECYLDKTGKPLVGWQVIDNKQYYLIPDAGIKATGWKTISNRRYYFDSDGIMQIGWQEINGATYYLGTDGKMAEGFSTVDGKGYYFGKDGMATGWQTINGLPCYFAETGEAIPGWQELNGEKYCFGDSGAALVGWHTLEEKLYYFTEEGKTLSGWQTLAEKQYYFAEDGSALTDWAEVDGVRCRFGADGAVLAGWFEDKTGKYYFAEKGCPLIGWHIVDEKQYYFAEDGLMATGWQELGADKYYFGETGEMAVGEVLIDGVRRFFTSKGKYIVVVNHDIPVPEDFQEDLVPTGSYRIHRSAKEALETMLKDCKQAGFTCVINNTYRSKDTQTTVWNRTVNGYLAKGMSYEQACAEAAKDTMEPGHSEHQLGLAVDLDGTKLAYQWLEANCWNYGFILRYPADSTEITGVIHEPWHFRYVGTELSLEMKEMGVCLEEYMRLLTK